MARIGIGYDIHRLIEGRRLILGGAEIPYFKGLLGHSDADVVIHAISDAVLGAAALGDIGEHFPNTDPAYKDMDSANILKKAISLASGKKLSISNIDVVVLAEEPKIYPYKAKMLERIAEIAGISKDRVNIKATTNEGVGSIGKGEAIAAYSVVTMEEAR